MFAFEKGAKLRDRCVLYRKKQNSCTQSKSERRARGNKPEFTGRRWAILLELAIILTSSVSPYDLPEVT